MDDSGAILSHLSALKDMLDQVNEEIEANYGVTRDIELEILKCCEFEREMAGRESELMKNVYELQFQIKGLVALDAESRASSERLQNELSSIKMKRDEILERMNTKRETFSKLCLDFQKEIDEEGKGKLGTLLAEKEYLENEAHLLRTKISSLQNSLSDFVEEIVEDINASNSALAIEIESGNAENNKLVKEINELKTTLLAAMSL
ncbi:hypothetical protein CTI12_AA241960 [Artemisia annua]|uniref:Uncharacterized protein n=1 Tax=Artemisia annua TaxID=35608 RepID=A0A2U1NDV8_ARTAN|nr:hypothetical protein CTI12_AA241960 [Artemisia annua]